MTEAVEAPVLFKVLAFGTNFIFGVVTLNVLVGRNFRLHSVAANEQG